MGVLTAGALPTAPHIDPVADFTALIVNSHSHLRNALIVRLRELGAGDITEAASLDEARVRAHVGGHRDLCLLDYALLVSDRRFVSELRAAGLHRVLVLSAADDPLSLRAAFITGARGYILAPRAAGTARPAGAPASGPAGYAAAPGATRLTSAPGGRPALPRPGPRPARGWLQRTYRLSARELDVLKLVAAGRSNRDAGVALQLSALTVKSHLARIARKLGTGDRAEMVIIALRAGLIV